MTGGGPSCNLVLLCFAHGYGSTLTTPQSLDTKKNICGQGYHRGPDNHTYRWCSHQNLHFYWIFPFQTFISSGFAPLKPILSSGFSQSKLSFESLFSEFSHWSLYFWENFPGISNSTPPPSGGSAPDPIDGQGQVLGASVPLHVFPGPYSAWYLGVQMSGITIWDSGTPQFSAIQIQ